MACGSHLSCAAINIPFQLVLVVWTLVEKCKEKSIGESMALHFSLPRSTELWLLIEMCGVKVLVLVLLFVVGLFVWSSRFVFLFFLAGLRCSRRSVVNRLSHRILD